MAGRIETAGSSSSCMARRERPPGALATLHEDDESTGGHPRRPEKEYEFSFGHTKKAHLPPVPLTKPSSPSSNKTLEGSGDGGLIGLDELPGFGASQQPSAGQGHQCGEVGSASPSPRGFGEPLSSNPNAVATPAGRGVSPLNLRPGHRGPLPPIGKVRPTSAGSSEPGSASPRSPRFSMRQGSNLTQAIHEAMSKSPRTPRTPRTGGTPMRSPRTPPPPSGPSPFEPRARSPTPPPGTPYDRPGSGGSAGPPPAPAMAPEADDSLNCQLALQSNFDMPMPPKEIPTMMAQFAAWPPGYGFAAPGLALQMPGQICPGAPPGFPGAAPGFPGPSPGFPSAPPRFRGVSPGFLPQPAPLGQQLALPPSNMGVAAGGVHPGPHGAIALEDHASGDRCTEFLDFGVDGLTKDGLHWATPAPGAPQVVYLADTSSGQYAVQYGPRMAATAGIVLLLAAVCMLATYLAIGEGQGLLRSNGSSSSSTGSGT